MKLRTVLLHTTLWVGIYLLWVVIFSNYSFALTRTMTVQFCYLIFIAGGFYALNYFALPALLYKKRYVLFVLSAIGIVALAAWLRSVVALQMNLYIFHTIPAPDLLSLFSSSVLNITLWLLITTTLKLLTDRTQTQQRLELLEKERMKHQLAHLKAQINPHALFNSLNTIYGHIDKSNQAARNILLQFSELLRYQLYDCEADRVHLDKEIEYLNNYIAFQRLRKDEQLIVNCCMKHVEPGITIAPLLLIVLVENAFKFVSNFSDRKNVINIQISTKDGELRCICNNTTEMLQRAEPMGNGGIGLQNLKYRLALLYPDKHQLTTNVQDEFYETILTINLL